MCRLLAGGSTKMCKKMKGHCFSEDEKNKLKDKGWSDGQVDFAEDSIIENKIKELIK